MSFWDLLFLGIALAMDAFAVSVSRGLRTTRFRPGDGLALGATFGGFQALMPLIGWLLGASLTGIIEKYDHWIAFAILTILGIKTVWETAREKEDDEGKKDEPLKLGSLLLLGVATSIDALAAGVTLTVSEIPLWVSLLVIGGVTFVLSFLGVFLGNRFGAVFRKPACYLGGIILILIGVKMLL
ncbi:MAG: manganese efflux pump, partial [Clostridia bacterium]|nr:manganese efflux pump [Clostridia bacterium]